MNIGKIASDFWLLMKTKRLYVYMIPGLVVTVIYLFLGFVFGWFDADTVHSEELGFWAKIWHWLVSGTKWFSRMLYELTVVTFFSPIMAMLSERCDTTLSGRKFDFSIERFFYELMRTIGIVVTALVFSGVVLGLWKIVTFFLPFLSFIDVVIIFVLKAFFIGFNFIDYSLERYHVSIGKSWIYGIKNPIIMIVLGAFFSVIIALPYIGVMLAPFYATLLSNALWHENNLKIYQQIINFHKQH